MGRDGEEKKRVRNGLSSFGIARVPCGEIEISKERSRNAEERRRRRPRRARRLCRSTCFERKIEKGAKGENFPLSPNDSIDFRYEGILPTLPTVLFEGLTFQGQTLLDP